MRPAYRLGNIDLHSQMLCVYVCLCVRLCMYVCVVCVCALGFPAISQCLSLDSCKYRSNVVWSIFVEAISSKNGQLKKLSITSLCSLFSSDSGPGFPFCVTVSVCVCVWARVCVCVCVCVCVRAWTRGTFKVEHCFWWSFSIAEVDRVGVLVHRTHFRLRTVLPKAFNIFAA